MSGLDRSLSFLPVKKGFSETCDDNRPICQRGYDGYGYRVRYGIFSLSMAEMVGPDGTVVRLDMQVKMLRLLEKRARKKGLSDVIEARLRKQDSLGLDSLAGTIDFALAFAVVHEVPDASCFFSEIYEAMKLGGKLLVVEPRGHVSEEDFVATVSVAGQQGFTVIDRPEIKLSRAVLVVKQGRV